ncbi:GNAT family N-acetyltransferase [Paraconexibacter antarcticus]|uniref:GNAT family N-acetyltransferase n=1 Tax=Paraconexibacter antarcticus TaxID=2949664 RepID=A0ABY5DYJ4_9ACTN|nr:GNAT family N-acetyltransferase [Paraconexibacter antarcticus]UTI65685.1 GNAT family N-acetyltransferase [Paraconexibacter antarcticus]
MEFTIARVTQGDLPELVALMRGYCAFYEETAGVVQASDADLAAFGRALLADPEREGVQLMAWSVEDGTPLGFATVFWTWSTLGAARLAVMNDLYVDPAARGTGLADALIAACRDEAREHGATRLAWQTAPDNHRAQAVYDRVGGRRSEWLDYDLPV